MHSTPVAPPPERFNFARHLFERNAHRRERIALIVRARLATGIEVVAGCVHLSHLRGDEARRREQLAAVLAPARCGCWAGISTRRSTARK